MSDFPDIEIYVRNLSLADIENWLAAAFSNVKSQPTAKNTHAFQVLYNENKIPVLVIEKAKGAFACIWFQAETTPWANDHQCAMALAAAVADIDQVEIRASQGSWVEGKDSEQWWSITNNQQQLIDWPDE